jgi:hypothetical protein
LPALSRHVNKLAATNSEFPGKIPAPPANKQNESPFSATKARLMTQTPDPHPTSLAAGILSFLVPGLGQMYQGRFSKGLLFFVCLLSLFHVGQAMGNWQNVYVPKNIGGWAADRGRPTLFAGLVNRWHYPGQFWIGVAAWPALWQYYGLPVPDAEKHPRLHNYQKEPPETLVNEFLVDSDKTPDLGLMYTVIAGVLNILVIYDAYAGPAFPPSSKKPKPPPEQEPAP